MFNAGLSLVLTTLALVSPSAHGAKVKGNHVQLMWATPWIDRTWDDEYQSSRYLIDEAIEKAKGLVEILGEEKLILRIRYVGHARERYSWELECEFPNGFTV